MTEELPFCECGECGLRVTKKGNRFIHGHNRRGIHHSHTTPAQIAADDARRGIPRSLEVGAAVSAAKLGKPHTSPAQIAADKANAERQRGGDDLVNHHYIYDESDLSKYTMEMTRSQHMSLHRNMQLLGLKIPHINTGHENEDELKLMEYIKKIVMGV